MKNFNSIFNQLTAMPKRLAMVLTVLFTLGVGSIFGEEYKLVTSTNDLVAGEKYLIGTGTSGTVNFISTESKANNRNLASGTVNSQKVTKTDQMMAFTLGGSTGSWTFKTNDYLGTAGYLNATSTTGNNYLKVVAALDKYAYFSISIASNVATITCTGKNSRNIVRYNSSSSPKIISCYTSGYNDVYLYKQVASCDKKVTLTKGYETNGTFTLNKSGEQETCDGLTTVVTPDPDEHYTVGSVTATTPTTGGAPTVKDNGNGTWSVTYAANSTGSSTINVTFKEAPKASITLSEAGATQSITGKYVGDSYQLPSTTTAKCGDKTFVGWSTVTIDNSAGKPASNFYEPDTEVTLEEENTFYAVFATASGSGASGDYELVTSAPDDWSGTYLIVDGTSKNCFNGSLTTLDAGNNYKSVTISNNKITSSSTTDSYSVSISKSTTSGQFYIQTASGYYIGSDAANSSASNELDASTTIKYNNSISINSNNVTIKGPDHILKFFYQTGQDWRFLFYKSTTTQNVRLPQLYRKAGGTTYSDYTTECDNSTDCNLLTFTTNIAANHTATYTQGASATALTVSAEYDGNATGVTYQWYSNTSKSNTGGTAIDRATDASYTPITSATGTKHYYCVATYDECKITSNVATIVVNAAAQIYTIKINPTLNGNVSVNPSEAAAGTTITLTPSPGSGFKLETLTVTRDDNDQSVPVTNNQFTMPASDVTVTAKFQAIQRLATPTNLGADDITTTSATLIWEWNESTFEAQLQYYDVYIYDATGTTKLSGPVTATEKSLSTTKINGLTLSPGTTYKFKVVALSKSLAICLHSNESDWGTFTTSTPTQLATPTNLKVTNITCTGATLSWNNVANNNGYTLSITNTSSSQTFNSNIAKDVTSGSPTLNPGTTYTWKVTAKGDGTNYNDSKVADGGSFTTNYKITYDVKGGTWTACADGCVANDEDFTICSTVPIKTRYNFMGWSTADDQTAEYQAEETIENVSANITLYAVWEQKTYTVILSENGTPNTLTPQASTSYTLPNELTVGSCEDDTKEFVGWSTVAIPTPGDKPTTKYYEPGETVTLTADETTFYAVFATPDGGGGETTLTIPYETLTNGLSGSYSTKTFTYEGFTFEINACVQVEYCQMRDNATLSYLYIPELPGAITKIAISDCKNASGSAYSGTLRLKTSKTRGNSATDDIASKTFTSVYSIDWDIENDTYKSGYLFTSAGLRIKDLSITYSGGTSYSDYTTTCVEVQKYKVTYTKGDGATGTAPTETPKAEGTTFNLASADGITKDGYGFAGWLCNNDSKTYDAGEEYTMPATDVTFTAQWSELPKYTVTFYNKGKEYSQVTQTIANAPIECPTGLVACDGYTFADWSTEELDGVSTFSKIEGEYTPTKNITLYAVYAEGNVTTNGWVKVTDLSTITEGTYALLSNNDYAFNGTISKGDGQSTSTAFVFDGEGVAISVPNGICEIQLIATGSGFTMYNESKGYLYAKAASSGNLEWHATENSSWSWSSTKENWVYADNNAYLRSYNNTFRTYGNSSNNAIYFAKKNVTSFTTSPACDPMITIGSEAPVMVTSAKDIRVDAVQNITISATNLDQNADKAQVSIKIVSDNSAFKFKEVDANGDGQATLTWTGIANATFDKTLCVTYTPTEAGQEETATLTVTAYRHNGSTEYATATMQVRGRSLPEQFVLVANTGDGWVALPNTLGTGSTASIPYPIAVEVDNDADPTSIPLAPSTTIYKAAARSTVNAIPTGLRFTTETGGYMQASTTETNIWLASNNSENMQSWTLNSTDFVDYSIRVNNSAEGHYLNYNTTQKKIGNYKSDNKLRILPVGAICEQHAAPEDLVVTIVRATSATIQWSAVATATLGYEYRIGATGEWTKVGNITELELTGLTSLTNYIVYVRASVEGSAINCSCEAEAEFTTLNCDDVPYDIHYASGANSVTVYWTCEAATSTISLYHDKEGLSLVETKTSVTSPCQFTGLDKFTTYYVQIQAGGDCASGMIQVATEQLDLDVVEWMSDGVVVDVNTDETVTVTLENEVQYGSGVGQVAEELFFSKYFEGSGNLKLLAIYNGTGKDIDLSTYRIDRGSNGNATKVGRKYNLSQLGTIKNGQEIIFYTKPSSGEYPYTCSQSFLASKVKESGVDANPRWILCDATEHNGVNFETMDFNGDDPLLLYKGNTLIDVFGVSTAAEQPSKKTQCSGRSENSWSADKVTNMDYNKTAADFEGGVVPEGVDLLNPTITAYTARVIMFRKNTVTSGSAAVANNKTDFVTFASEWEARSVCKSGDDGNLTCGAYQELGKFNYADYYTKFEAITGEQVFDKNDRLEDGTIKIEIPSLSTYSCMNIKFNVKVGELTINETAKVPILIADEQSTKGGEVFTNLKTTLGTKIVNGSEVTIEPLTDEQLLKKCETCDIVVLANGKLTHNAGGIAQFTDLTIYPEGTFNNASNFTVNRLLVHAKRDEVGCAIIENEGVTLTTNAIAHTKRIDAQYWYPFSLPYNCNIADITQGNGESLGTYGVHWGIQYYDGRKRQESGTSAGIGQSSNFWTPIYNSNEQLKAYQGYMIALFDASVSSPTEMRTIYFPPVSAQIMYTESGTDSKETTITSWNVNLEAEKRHHGWNFTGSPYISVFNPQATGLSEDFGLFSEVLIVSGHYDQGSNEYLYDDHYVYVSVPSPNGAKYYDQYIASATSLKPFTAYFVQAIDPTSGNDETQTLAYAKVGRELPSSAPRRSSSTRQRVFVELNVTAPDGQTDNTGVWVDECYTPTYEIAADLTKMYVADAKPQLYTLDSNNEKMAYNAIPDENAENVILGLYAPVAGNYTLALNNRVSRLQGAETVELLYNGNVVANLFYEDYVISADKGIVNGYSLRIRRRTLVDSAIDNITGQVMHIMNENGILTIEGIATDAQVSVYDMLGRLVAVQSADGKTNISMPIMTQGVYNVVVGNDYGKTTVKVVLK